MRLRILHAIHDFLPRHRAGSEIYARELCRALAPRHHVTVLCADYDPARRHGDVTWRLHDELPVVEVVNNWPCAGFEDTYRPPRIGVVIDHLLRALQPDVVHLHNVLNLTFDLPALARARRIPVVATLHDYALVCASGGQRFHRADAHVCRTIDPARCARCFRESPFHAQAAFARATSAAAPGLADRAARFVRRFPRAARAIGAAARHAPLLPVTRADIEQRLAAARTVFDDVDLFVAPSPSMAREFQQLGLDANKIRVSDYGFAPLAPAPRTAAHGPLRIGFVGTLVWHKGVHVLVDAVRELPGASVSVSVFGDVTTFPDYVAELRARAAGLPIEFRGGFPPERAADVYAQLDVLVVPSLWLENSPLVIHEAFMAGVPVVGARIGGIADLVVDGRTGLLYTPESAGDLARALRAIVDDRALLDRFRRALPAVKSIAADGEEWERIYSSVVQPREMVPTA